MYNELGHFALILAFCIALVQMVVPLIGAAKGWNVWMRVGEPAATLQFILIAVSFAALTHAFVTSDFSLLVVTANSHTLKPMLYKITGVWGNHEGSLLLWVLILALFGASAAWFGGGLPDRLRALWRLVTRHLSEKPGLNQSPDLSTPMMPSVAIVL